jgi:beta-lactamase class A
MHHLVKTVLLFAFLQVFCGLGFTQTEIVAGKNYGPPPMVTSEKLQEILSNAVTESINEFAAKGVTASQVAATLIDLRDPSKLAAANVRGEERIYPASVVKLFYLAAIERQIEAGKITPTPELERGIRDMIVVSSNEATQYILDVLTDTSSGAELPKSEFEKWQYKRNRVNRFFTAMGYKNINVNQKTFCEDAYGIEQQSRNYKGENRNMVTTNATARLLSEIVTGRMATPEATARMMTLLHRDPFAKDTGDADDQSHGFTGRMFIARDMKSDKLWSKAGWTSTARHDAAYVETADGLKFVIVIFTEKHANESALIPAIAGRVLDGLRRAK